ncbi:MAG: thiamine ABC transporter substrate-binding protein [Acidimicrobiia bacterium]|nr:thiamine ABC transporter substrate-binding protein [Acidimicrobiia bacterium]
MTRRSTVVGALAIALVVLAAACTTTKPSGETPDRLTLLVHDSFALSEGTLEAFTDRTGIAIDIVTGGDAPTMLNQAILTKDNPIADVIYGIDNTLISRAADNGILVPHAATAIDTVDPRLRLDGDLATPIDYGDVCVNYDIDALATAEIDPPSTLEDLVDPRYADMLVVENPATSSPGLAFLMATIAAYPDGATYDWTDYWSELFANGVTVAADWSEAYYTHFTRAGGDRPLVVSYASSPPVEVLFGELDTAPTGVLTDGCFRQIEYAGVLSGSPYPSAAGELVDFLLSTSVQEDIPLNMFVFPTNETAKLADVFVEYTVFPPESTLLEPGTIEQNRDDWIEQWTTLARS